MNHSTLSVLLDDNVKTVGCVFNEGGKVYTYKTLDKSIKVGDLVAVECFNSSDDNNYGIKVIKVVKVDTQLDFNASTNYKWVIQKIDMTSFEELKFKEDKLISDFSSLEMQHRKAKLREALGIAGIEQLKLTGASNV